MLLEDGTQCDHVATEQYNLVTKSTSPGLNHGNVYSDFGEVDKGSDEKQANRREIAARLRDPNSEPSLAERLTEFLLRIASPAAVRPDLPRER
jgi:hypothetical protein